MSAKILDGKQLAAQLSAELKNQIQRLAKAPVLFAISLMDDPAIDSYAASQEKTANNLGIKYERINISAGAEGVVIHALRSILHDYPKAAIFIFKPVPKSINFQVINSQLPNIRSVEGVYPLNLGKLFLSSKDVIHPPTAAAAMALLKSAGVPLPGKTAVVIGRSETVGKPLVHLLLSEDVSVSVCHSKTPVGQLIAMVKSADIVCACVGKAHFVKREWIKPGAIVIDIGINDIDGKIVGDVAPDVKEVAGYISPVPGGVGPVTSVCLMKNVFLLNNTLD